MCAVRVRVCVRVPMRFAPQIPQNASPPPLSREKSPQKANLLKRQNYEARVCASVLKKIIVKYDKLRPCNMRRQMKFVRFQIKTKS